MTRRGAIRAAYERCLERAIELAKEAPSDPKAMTCLPPPPEKPFAYGDLVPLGFLLMALRRCHADVPSERIRELEQLLLSRRRRELWAFHSGTLITATDSALVLLGLDRPESVAALEVFADGKGGYVPQLWSDREEPDRMRASLARRHWCQSCYATTCLVRYHQRRFGLPVGASLDGLASGFERRSGLYFGNPHLVDWAFALAIQGDEAAAPLGARLASELLASRNDDGLFGSFDRALSTAWAILALAALGFSGAALLRSQEALAELLLSGGVGEKAVPFYSSQRLDTSGIAAGLAAVSALMEPDPHVARTGGQTHGVSYYEDTHGIIGTAMGLLALAREPGPDTPGTEGGAAPHPRYSCPTHADYVAAFALPPYLSGPPDP